MDDSLRDPAPFDYDADPQRYRLGMQVTGAHAPAAVAEAAAHGLPVPLHVTKRGAILVAH